MCTEDHYFSRTWRRTISFIESSGTTLKKNKRRRRIESKLRDMKKEERQELLHSAWRAAECSWKMQD